MKYDLNKKPSKFAERVLADLYGTLFTLLQEKPLENITVNEICGKANYPRATFYNYFDDIYDLLSYAWMRVISEIKIDDYLEMESKERTETLFVRLYDYVDERKETLDKLLAANAENGYFVDSVRRVMREQIYNIIRNTPCSEKYKLPYDMIAEHYANTIILILERCFIGEKKMKKREALEAVRYLLEGL